MQICHKCVYNNAVNIEFDPVKREWTLRHRGVDFTDAGKVFAGITASRQDLREDYGEDRFITAGHLDGRCVVMV